MPIPRAPALKLWHIAALLALGLIVGEASPGTLTDVFREATLLVCLPALIFEAAWNLDLSTMLRSWKPIILLAIPGVAITALLVAAGAHYIGGVAVPLALLLGAILSATDPVAVVAIFRRLPVPKALATIVESESLLNDAIAVVAYRAVLAAIVAGATVAQSGLVAVHALEGSLLGIALGIVVALVAGQAMRLHGNVPVQSVAAFAGAYGAYFLAEHLHWSGIFALIACGVTLREYDRRARDIVAARGVERVWACAAAGANVALFFLIGAAVEPVHLLSAWRAVVATLIAVVVARALLAYGLLALVPGFRLAWKTVVRMAGVRGALGLALAIGLPASIGERQLIVDATFAVVVLTIVLSVLTVEPRIRNLRLGED